MARKTLKDESGKAYEVEVPDDDDDDAGDDDDDENTIYLDAEDIEWLQRKRREEAEQNRRSSSSSQKTKTNGKVVKIRAKQTDSGSSGTSGGDGKRSRKKVLRLA